MKPSFELFTITDPKSGTRAKILPYFGMNCYAFEAIVDREPFHVIWSDDDYLLGKMKPSQCGIPILFPYAGRIRGTSFSYQGKKYNLPAVDSLGNAMHGFVIDRPWRILEQDESILIGEFCASIDQPDLLDHWPADFLIRVVYQVFENRLTTTFHIKNPSDRPLPFSLGTHPYFRIPKKNDHPVDSIITIPAQSVWEHRDMLPTGQILPVESRYDLRAGVSFNASELDDVFTNLKPATKTRSTDISHNKRSILTTVCHPDGPTIEQAFDSVFRQCIAYTPIHREAVCVEPYMAVPNTYDLDLTTQQAGLQILSPGESLEATIDIKVLDNV